MYDISKLTKLEKELAEAMRRHFVEFFKSHKYTDDNRAVMARDVGSLTDIDSLYYGTGFYVILTDYQAEANDCKLVVDGLKAIYRGHCYTVKKRMVSHLMNDHYRASLPEMGVRYDVCMKLDGNNGINITAEPYHRFRWRVVIHKMKGSSKLMREQAELAFDEVFSRPLGSRELPGGGLTSRSGYLKR